jgi:hypothetical protein
MDLNAGSSAATRTATRLLASFTNRPARGTLRLMKKRMLIGTLALGVLLFAVAGWTVDGVRWAFTPLRTA